MSNDNVSGKYTHLLGDGPCTADELNGHPAVDERRLYDIRQFNPKDQTTAIFHLDEHDTERVLRQWIAENRSYLAANETTYRSITYSLSDGWKETWLEIKDDPAFDWVEVARPDAGGNTDDQPGTTCPKCGETDVRNLPNHLRGCDG